MTSREAFAKTAVSIAYDFQEGLCKGIAVSIAYDFQEGLCKGIAVFVAYDFTLGSVAVDLWNRKWNPWKKEPKQDSARHRDRSQGEGRW